MPTAAEIRACADFLAAEPALRSLRVAFAEGGAPERLVVTAPGRMLDLIAPRIEGATVLPSETPEPELLDRLRGLGAALLI